MKKDLMSTINRGWYRFLVFGLAGTVLVFIPMPAAFADEDLLEDFFVKVRTLQADFHQVVLDEDLVPLQETSGQMWLARPGRFRWSYGQPVEQEVLADGLRLVQMLDQLDQITRLQFDNVIVNDQLPNDLFRLKLPAGVDMIKEEL